MDQTIRATRAEKTRPSSVREIMSMERDLPVLTATMAWIRGYLARPHADLGRHGPVCPFVPRALSLDQIFLSVIHADQSTPDDIESTILGYRDQFLAMEAASGAADAASAMAARIAPELERESADVEARIQRVCEYYFADDPQLGLVLRDLSAGSGPLDRAADLYGYADMYEARHDVVSADKLHYRATDVADARRLAGQILEAVDGRSYRAIVTVLPNLAPDVVEGIQSRLKPRFVDVGLMIGEFHPASRSPGLHNPHFRPLVSPFPMLAIRRIVETDLVFLTRESYPALQRIRFLRSYLRVVAGSVGDARVEAARRALEQAEAEDAALRR